MSCKRNVYGPLSKQPIIFWTNITDPYTGNRNANTNKFNIPLLEYREGKASRVIAFLLRILIGITAGALFSGIFWIECTIATKKNTRSVVFMELCLLDLLLMIIPAVWLLLA